MRKVVIRQPGGYERLLVEEAEEPRPGPGEVAVRVAAAGVNYADCIVRMGLYASAKEFVGWPITPGFEVSGTLESGERVMAVTRFGGYAERVVVPEHQVFRIPEGTETVAAAGFPTIFLTAWYALFGLAQPRPGSRVLVHSAAGGVGSALLQLARVAECEPVAVVGGPHKVEAARALGASQVIDRSRTDLWAAAAVHGPYAAVFDASGPATLKKSYEHLAPTGRLVVYGFHSMMPRGRGTAARLPLLWNLLRIPRFNPLRMVNDNKSVMAFNLSYLFDREDLLREAMAKLLDWLEAGRIRLPRVTRYPVAEVRSAHRDLETGQTVGKLILTF